MPPRRKVETVEDETEVPPAKKTSEEESPPISPDKGATGETTSSENKEAGMKTGLSEEEEEARYKEEYNNAVFKLLKNFGRQHPELVRDIVMEALFYPFCGYSKDIVKWLKKLNTKNCVSLQFVISTIFEFHKLGQVVRILLCV